MKLIAGPIWLNAARVGFAVFAAIAFEFSLAMTWIALLSAASAVVGWRWSRRSIWRPELGYPTAFIPVRLFFLPLMLYSFGLMAGAALLTGAAVRAAG